MEKRTQGIVWVVTRIESSARNFGPIERIFARQRDGEEFAAECNRTKPEGCEDIVYDCSAFTLYG